MGVALGYNRVLPCYGPEYYQKFRESKPEKVPDFYGTSPTVAYMVLVPREEEGGRRSTFADRFKSVVISKEQEEGARRTYFGWPLQIRGQLKGGGESAVPKGGSAKQLRPTVPNPVLVAKGGGEKVGDSTLDDPVRIWRAI